MFARKHSCFHLAHPPRDCAPDTSIHVYIADIICNIVLFYIRVPTPNSGDTCVRTQTL